MRTTVCKREVRARPNLSAVGQQLKSHKFVVRLVGKCEATKSDVSAAEDVDDASHSQSKRGRRSCGVSDDERRIIVTFA